MTITAIPRITEMNIATAAYTTTTSGNTVDHVWTWSDDCLFKLRVYTDLDTALITSVGIMIPMIVGGFGSGSVVMRNGATTPSGVEYAHMKDIVETYPEVYECIRQMYEHRELVEYVKSWCVLVGSVPNGFNRMLDLADKLKPYHMIHLGAAAVSVNKGVPLFMLGDTSVDTVLDVACVVSANTVTTMYNNLDRNTTMQYARKALDGHQLISVLNEFGEKILDGFEAMYAAAADVVRNQEAGNAVDPAKQQAFDFLRAVHDKAISND